MLRRTTAGFAARTVRLLLLPTLAALALACDDASTPLEPLVPDQGVPPVEAAPQGESVPTRHELAALLGGPRYWADGYALTNASTAAGSYEANPSSSFNRSGGPITITKPAGTTGRYIVTFSGLSAFLGSRSTVHVTSDAGVADDTYCKPVTAYLVSDKIEVRCFRASTRTASNAAFRVLVTRNYSDLAFAYAQQPTSTNYSPSAQGSWNPAGTSKVIRHGVGQYELVFNNLGSQLGTGVGGHPQVNAVGTGGAYCKVLNWGGLPNLSIGVRCFTAAGQLVDSKFTALFLVPTDHLAYAWADQPSAASSSPVAMYRWNPAGGAVTIYRIAAGTYTIVWTGAGGHLLNSGTVQVTASGSDNTQCKVNTEISGQDEAYVRCFGPTGVPTDARYTVLIGS